MDIDRFLSKLYLRRIGLYPQEAVECAILDYAMGDGDEITNYLIVAKFDGLGRLAQIVMES
jgi:hypothetical protein